MNLHWANDDPPNQITFDPKRSGFTGNEEQIENQMVPCQERCPAIFFEDRKTTKNVLALVLEGTLKMSLSKWTSVIHSARGMKLEKKLYARWRCNRCGIIFLCLDKFYEH